ncbi:unnamed protein product, partial [Sphagnum compactum]
MLPFGALKIRSDAQAASLIGQCLCLSTPVCWGLQKFLESSELVSECMQDYKEEFEPFVEDEVPFDEECKTMQDDGTCAGHMELQATSLVTHWNICIHQLMTPRWQILNFESADACTLHLSYHDGEHYNSVRRLDNFGIGPAQPITIEVSLLRQLLYATPTTEPPPPKDKVDGTYADTGESPLQAVMEGTGNTNVDEVQEVLRWEVEEWVVVVVVGPLLHLFVLCCLLPQPAPVAIEVSGEEKLGLGLEEQSKALAKTGENGKASVGSAVGPVGS